MIDYTKSMHGHAYVEGYCLQCEVEKLRSRLQALEQNTVPAGSAKQKPREWWMQVAEFEEWQHVGPAFASKELALVAGYVACELVRVREVLDE